MVFAKGFSRGRHSTNINLILFIRALILGFDALAAAADADDDHDYLLAKYIFDVTIIRSLMRVLFKKLLGRILSPNAEFSFVSLLASSQPQPWRAFLCLRNYTSAI